MSAVRSVEENREGRDFVAGDVHGEFPTQEAVLTRVDFQPDRDRLFSLGDLIDRGPHSADALQWMESARIALCVRGNHEQILLACLEADEDLEWPDIAQPMPPRLSRDVPRASWARWRAMIRAMPMAATVQTAHGPVGLVHASPTAPSWQTTLDNLRAGDTDTIQVAMWSIARARGYTRQAIFEGVPLVIPIRDVRAVLTGHCIMPDVTVSANVWHLDTGAGTPDGCLMLARIDTDPIETITVSTRTLP